LFNEKTWYCFDSSAEITVLIQQLSNLTFTILHWYFPNLYRNYVIFSSPQFVIGVAITSNQHDWSKAKAKAKIFCSLS
jgi:hypothetical protein